MMKRKRRCFLALGMVIVIAITLGVWLNKVGMQEENQRTQTLSEDVSQQLQVSIKPEYKEETKQQLELIMVGDVLLHDRLSEFCKQENGTYDYSMLFKELKEEIQSADVALVNQEVIIGGKELGITGYPCFNADYELANDLEEAGFDVILHGTNHALDKGKRGVLNCISYWEHTFPQMEVLGIHDSKEDQEEICVVEKNGIKIAILNYTYGTNGINPPADMPYLVDYMKEDKVISDIQRAKELADFVVVCPHWGTEYRLEQDSMQTKWRDLFLEQEVDLVLGTHPHVIEPIEMVSSETGHKMLVYYSLGNYVNYTAETGAGVANRMLGGMAKVMLEKDNNGQVKIQSYGVQPIVCHIDEAQREVRVYDLADYSQALAQQNAIRKQDAGFSYEYEMELGKKVWGEELMNKNYITP